MSTLSVAELQAQVETDLDSTTLQQIIDAVEKDIEEHVGPGSNYVYELDHMDLLTVIRLPVRASSIDSIVEYTDSEHNPTKTTLAADDYELSDDGWFVRRLSDGTNSDDTWGWHVVITFTPAANVEKRKQAAIQLARLEITHTGYENEAVGDWSAKSLDARKERAKILRALDQSLID